ncbi:MAG: adenosine deaminase [Pyrinomonadaceae bacterium]|nr:adenosine deaminase [Pyrinomonadaceae bacterium]
MRKVFSKGSSLTNIAWPVMLVLFFVITLHAQSASDSKTTGTSRPRSAEERTARYFESLRKSPPQQLAFLLKMPKGGDLHNHLSGSIYAESYIQWAAENGLCVNNQTMALVVPPPKSTCDPKSDQPPASTALTNSVLYRQMVDAWSMRNWQLSGQSGHDHFFDAFGKFGPATYNQTGRMIADAASRAGRGQLMYLELMLTPDGVMSSQIGQKVGWDGNVASTLAKLQSNGIAAAATTAVKTLQDAEAQKNQLLKCDTAQADVGCSVTIRYVSQVSRGGSLGAVFAQMVTGFALANDPNSKVVALNLVQGEDGLASMQNFPVHMQMLHSLRPLYPQARLTLHAGELAPGLVPPEGLRFHIRESVMAARADRIGHGVDIMNEHRPYELLEEMARRNVMVEVCLSSNDLILGVSGAQHPLAIYLQYGVPVALATDDEGVSRSEMSREFLKAAQEQGLGYVQLKTMARNSLQYAFIGGGSLWKDSRKFVPVNQCAQLISPSCRQYVTGSEKARLQWQLEEDFKTFERGY